MDRIYISIAGLIAAGKSTLAKEVSTILNIPLYEESVDNNPYLPLFYETISNNIKPNPYAFPLQIHLLNKRFEQQQQIIWSNKSAIQDRSIYEDSIFAKMLNKSGAMSKLDYETYKNIFRNMSHLMSHPTVIIYLDVTPEESFKRLKKRNRDMETTVSLEYLQQLHVAYDEFFKEIAKKIFVIRVDANQDLDELTQQVINEIKHIA